MFVGQWHESCPLPPPPPPPPQWAEYRRMVKSCIPTTYIIQIVNCHCSWTCTHTHQQFMRWLVVHHQTYSTLRIHIRYDHGENRRAIIDKEKLALLQLAVGFFSCTSLLLIDRYIVANDLHRASTILSSIVLEWIGMGIERIRYT